MVFIVHKFFQKKRKINTKINNGKECNVDFTFFYSFGFGSQTHETEIWRVFEFYGFKIKIGYNLLHARIAHGLLGDFIRENIPSEKAFKDGLKNRFRSICFNFW